MSVEKWYTVHIELINGEKFEFKDCDKEKFHHYRREVWVTGFVIQRTGKSWEIINPLIIKSVFIFEQEQKFTL